MLLRCCMNVGGTTKESLYKNSLVVLKLQHVTNVRARIAVVRFTTPLVIYSLILPFLKQYYAHCNSIQVYSSKIFF